MELFGVSFWEGFCGSEVVGKCVIQRPHRTAACWKDYLDRIDGMNKLFLFQCYHTLYLIISVVSNDMVKRMVGAFLHYLHVRVEACVEIVMRRAI